MIQYNDIEMRADGDSVRYTLIKEGKRMIYVFGVNPSTATDSIPDPTMRKVIRFAGNNGFDGFAMMNLYPLRSTNPNALPKEIDRVILVEAARPMVTKEQVEQILNDPYPSSTFVRPLVNTVVFRDGTYVNRSDMYDMLTPQAFDRNMLEEAYQSGRFNDMTDETRVMFEYHGVKPHFIETESNLFKITYPGDLDIIESIYRTRIAKGEKNE